MTKSSVLRFSKYGVFQERGIYRRKIREKQGVFIERKSIANSKKARKCWAFEAMPSRAYESSFVVNGGERGIRTLDTLLTHTHFPGVLLQPLGHLTVLKAQNFTQSPFIKQCNLLDYFAKNLRLYSVSEV